MEPTATATVAAALRAAHDAAVSTSSGWFWIDGIAIPYVALFTLSIIEGGWSHVPKKFFELGVDACILGIGVCGALFGNHHLHLILGEHASSIAILTILFELALTGICLNSRVDDPPTGRAAMSVFLGTLILALNTVLTLHYS